MSPKNCAILFAVFNLAGCGHGPPVDPCVFDAPNKVFYCAPHGGGEPYERSLAEMDGGVAFSKDDAQILIEWIKRKSKKGTTNGASTR